MKHQSKTFKLAFIIATITLLTIIIIAISHQPKIYPNTVAAPTLKLTWPETLNPQDATRFTPYGIWESTKDTPAGIAYEPANEMQFYIKTSATDLLTVAPGIVVRSEAFQNGVGNISIRYGENYVVTYLHAIPDDSLKTGDKVETGQVIGKMEKAINPHHGEETWWEVQLTTNRDGIIRTLPPYDYFDQESQQLLDQIAENSKEIGPHEVLQKPYWTVSTGCSWIKYTKVPEWWDSNRFGGFWQKESERDFVKNIDSNWKVADDKGNIVGPTDNCK